MRLAAALLLVVSHTANAEQPDGTYTLDRGAMHAMTDAKGRPLPSCGGEKVFGGHATFIVDYGLNVTVNGRAWRFEGHTVRSGEKRPRHDALVIVADPDGAKRISLWFGRTGRGAAHGSLVVRGRRDGSDCADAWDLGGSYRPKQRRP